MYEAITEMIISRDLEPGQHLVELDLAETLGVSRQPVREALQRLHTEGWVVLRPGYGAFVHTPTDDEVDQLLTARALLESESARIAAGRADEQAIARLREAAQLGFDALESDDIEEFVSANAVFHGRVTELAGNRVIADFAGQVDRRVRWYYTPIAPNRGPESCAEHVSIIEAIATGDAERAADLMRGHAERTRQTYLSGRPSGTQAEPSEPQRRRRPRRRTAGTAAGS